MCEQHAWSASHAVTCVNNMPSQSSHAVICVNNMPGQSSHAVTCVNNMPGQSSHAMICVNNMPGQSSHAVTCVNNMPGQSSHAVTCVNNMPGQSSYSYSPWCGVVTGLTRTDLAEAGSTLSEFILRMVRFLLRWAELSQHHKGRWADRQMQ